MRLRLFEEFITVSDYKEWNKYCNTDFYNRMGEYFAKFEDHDKNYNRIYFDLKVNHDNFQIIIPQELSDFMRWNNYPILDYELGICRDRDGREIKIGKLLNRLGEERLLKTYNQSKTNTLKNINDLQIVISRHPYDIIGMSTGRGWTTCHDLNDRRYGGKHLHHLKNNLRNGVLIAYLIRKSDRNINNPISRCLIFNDAWRTNGSSVHLDKNVYGTDVKEFTKFLRKFCKKYNDSQLD